MLHDKSETDTSERIEAQVLSAQQSGDAADKLIRDYLPFIKSETRKFLGRAPIEGRDDELGIAMYAFHEAAMSYKVGRGAFLKLASVSIKHSLIDHRRRESRHMGHLSLDSPTDDEDSPTLAERLADRHNELEIRHERAIAKTEIEQFSSELASFGLSLADIAESCPRQARTLNACHRVLAFAKTEPELIETLVKTGKLPISELCAGSGVERKTVERHRRYIVAILLAYTNGFEIIRGHLAGITPEKGGSGR